MKSKRIPLFPLGVVLFPGLPLPLHIFEERYKLLINTCLADDKPFGIVYSDNQSIARVGCMATIQSVLKTYEDGRMDILTEGADRFRITRTLDEKLYDEAMVVPFRDRETEGTEEFSEQTDEARKLLARVLELRGERVPDLADIDASFLTFLIGAIGDYSLEEKQKLLESDSVPGRLEQVLSSAEIILSRRVESNLLDRARKSNGKLPGKSLN